MFNEIKLLSTTTKQFAWFETFYHITQQFYLLFYSVILFQLTDSLQIVFIDKLILSIGTFLSIVIFNYVIRKTGYLAVWRVTFIVRALVGLGLFIFWQPFVNTILTSYPIVSLLFGLQTGSFWVSHHYVKAGLLKKVERTYVLQILGSMAAIISVIAPILIGFLVDYVVGFQWILFIGAIINLAALFEKSKFTQKPPAMPIISKEIVRKMREHPYFKQFVLIYFFDAMQDELQAHFWTIAPFLIIGSQFGYGAFVSVVALISGLFLYVRRHVTLEKNLQLGYVLHSLRVAATAFLAVIWNPVVLFLRGLVMQLAISLGQPIDSDIDANLRASMFIKSDEANILQVNFLLECMKFLARLIGLACFILLIGLVNNEQENFLRLAWAFVAAGSLVAFSSQVWLWKKVRS